MERYNFVNPATRLTTGGMLDILSLTRIHGVNISVSWFEEGDYYVLFVRKGNIAEKSSSLILNWMRLGMTN